MEKKANIAKVKAFMSQGMGMKEAIKAAYPDYTPAQVAGLAAKMGGMGKMASYGAAPKKGKLKKYMKSPKKKLAAALKEKLAGNPDLAGGMPSTTRPGFKVYPDPKRLAISKKMAMKPKAPSLMMGGKGKSNRKLMSSLGM